MSDEHENLGPANSWHIRSVPEAVRQAFVDRAYAERISVADLLTRIVTGSMVDVSGDASTEHMSTTSPHKVDADRLKAFLECADLLERADLPKASRAQCVR